MVSLYFLCNLRRVLSNGFGSGSSRLECCVLGVWITTFVCPFPQQIRQTVRRIITVPSSKSKSPHCRPQTSPIRNPSSICRSIPILRVVGSDKRNSRRESCSVRVKGCGSGFCVCGSLTHISMGGMRCRCAAYLQIRRSIPRHSCAEDAPSGLWLRSVGDRI